MLPFWQRCVVDVFINSDHSRKGSHEARVYGTEGMIPCLLGAVIVACLGGREPGGVGEGVWKV